MLKGIVVFQLIGLTRLRQKGRLWAMMLMLKILRTFWGGIGSLVTSLGSASSSAWLSGGAWGAFSLPEDLVIFLLGPDEKRGIGQCRSIANPRLVGHNSEEENLWDLLSAWITELVQNPTHKSFKRQNSSKCLHQARCPGFWPLLNIRGTDVISEWLCWIQQQLSCTELPPHKHKNLLA